ncbi:MAG: HEPN domain-containing protein [Candidatus Bipolaricaulis sp.]|nr:HEPN domain-containing protein [Candidatus Bipolaricaulis sp.]
MKSRGDLAQGWLEKARRDLITAERELERLPTFTDIVCFHCQQAVEKGLKALLIVHGITPPKTHALEDLALLVSQAEPEAESFARELAALTPYAVTARHPEFSEPTKEEAQSAIDIARRVLSWIQRRAGVVES